MNICSQCVMPSSRPDLAFVDGVCSACLSTAKRQHIDWAARKRELIALLDRYHGECIVPSSGGKDSSWIALTLLELGAHVTVVTATTCHLTTVGRKNIDNLARYATTIEYSPNKTVRAKLNRLGLELVGDISWPEHLSIFSTPFRAAQEVGSSLIFYGENPQEAYGGPLGSQEAMQMTRRWVTEFGGHLGLRAQDVIGMSGISKRDMQDYELPKDLGTTEAHFLGQYFEWDSHRNAKVAIEHGMFERLPSIANWWTWENLDNAQTGLHDHMMFRKYGFGRFASQISVDVRKGLVSRQVALDLCKQYDGLFPETYMDVSLNAILENIGYTRDQLFDVMDQYTNWSLHSPEVTKRLKEDRYAQAKD